MKLPENVKTGELAELVGLSSRRVQQLAEAGYMTKTSRGQYLLAESVQGYVRFLSETQTPIDEELGKQLLEERVLKTREERKRLQYENELQAGSLVRKSSAKLTLRAYFDEHKRLCSAFIQEICDSNPDATAEAKQSIEQQLIDYYNRCADIRI